MWDILDIDFALISKMVDEFKSNFGVDGEVDLECVYNGRGPNKNRQVFRLQIGSDVFAMKVYHSSNQAGTLQNEFKTLQGLYPHFAKAARVEVPKPLYMSPAGSFFVMTFSEGKTASEAMTKNTNSRSIGQVYRRAGLFLHELHKYKNLSTGKLYPNWMFEAIDEAATVGPYANSAQFNWMYKKLRAQSKALTGQCDTKGFCHGDFHSSNLILGRGITHGIDFTEVSQKLVVYDIVDFLKRDIYREDVLADVDTSGVSRHCKTMFFKLYRHPVNMDILDFCLRGRLLIDWISITHEQHGKSPFQRNKFEQLQKRLSIAFQH